MEEKLRHGLVSASHREAEELRPREVNSLGRGHPARKSQTSDPARASRHCYSSLNTLLQKESKHLHTLMGDSASRRVYGEAPS